MFSALMISNCTFLPIVIATNIGALREAAREGDAKDKHSSLFLRKRIFRLFAKQRFDVLCLVTGVSLIGWFPFFVFDTICIKAGVSAYNLRYVNIGVGIAIAYLVTKFNAAILKFYSDWKNKQNEDSMLAEAADATENLSGEHLLPPQKQQQQTVHSNSSMNPMTTTTAITL